MGHIIYWTMSPYLYRLLPVPRFQLLLGILTTDYAVVSQQNAESNLAEHTRQSFVCSCNACFSKRPSCLQMNFLCLVDSGRQTCTGYTVLLCAWFVMLKQVQSISSLPRHVCFVHNCIWCYLIVTNLVKYFVFCFIALYKCLVLVIKETFY